MVDRSITLSVQSDLENVPLLGCAVHALCRDAGMSAVDTYHVELCLVEGVTNAIRHAYRQRPEHTVVVSLRFAKDRLALTVEDEGAPMPPRDTPPTLDYDPDDLASLPEGGMGLYLLHSLMDHVDYVSRDGRNVLTLERRFGRG